MSTKFETNPKLRNVKAQNSKQKQALSRAASDGFCFGFRISDLLYAYLSGILVCPFPPLLGVSLCLRAFVAIFITGLVLIQKNLKNRPEIDTGLNPDLIIIDT